MYERIEKCETYEGAYAVKTSEGIAVYFDLLDALEDVRANDVTPSKGGSKFYRKNKWRKLPDKFYRNAFTS